MSDSENVKGKLSPHYRSLQKHVPFGFIIEDFEIIDYKYSGHVNPRIHGTVRITCTDIISGNKNNFVVKSFLKK